MIQNQARRKDHKDDHSLMYLCRFFTKKEHAQAFRSGNIRVQRLGEYRRKENNESGSQRGDSNDGLVRVIPHEGTVVSFHPDGSNAPLIFRPIEPIHNYVNPYVLCMCARTYACVDSLSSDALEHMLQPPTKWKRLGKWVVLLSKPDIFFIRLKQAASKTQCEMCAYGLVSYYTTPPGSDKVSTEDAVLRKEEKFAWQSEFRFAFDNASISSSASLTFVIGDISDIAHLYDVETLFSGTFKIASNH